MLGSVLYSRFNQNVNLMGNDNLTLINGYKEALNNKVAASIAVKKKIDASKTILRKKYYSKKLVNNNEIVAMIALKLNRLLELEKENEK